VVGGGTTPARLHRPGTIQPQNSQPFSLWEFFLGQEGRSISVFLFVVYEDSTRSAVPERPADDQA